VKVALMTETTHNPFNETHRVSCLRENLTSSSDGEGLETGRPVSLVPRQSLTRQLIFKASKRSFNLDKRLTSNNDNIIESLILSLIIASFASCVVLEIGAKQLAEKEQWAISVQRIAHIVVLVAREFIHYLTTSSRKAAAALVGKIILLSGEMFEKNHRHRPTSLGQLNSLLAC
jgi:hypothetical protein